MLIRFIILVFVIIFLGCENDEGVQVDLKSDYFPLYKGHWISYKVDSIIFSDIALPLILADTISYQLKEVIGDTFTDNEGDTYYKVETFRRSQEGFPWQFDRIYLAGFKDGRLITVEENLRFIKLIFPPRESKSWSGNSHIPAGEFEYLEGWNYEYIKVDEPYSLNGFSFDSTLAVQQIDEENLISKKYSVEYYSRKTGLIFQEMMILEKQNINNSWDKPEKGVIVRKSIINFSN